MGADSPAASPRTDSPRTNPSTTAFLSPPSGTDTSESGRESEFLDMEDEESEEESGGERARDITAGIGVSGGYQYLSYGS